MRSAKLNTYAGQAAFPGGKSDTLEESPWATARREAYEEIGLPLTEDKLRAKTELGVRPCVAYLCPSSPISSTDEPSVEEKLIPRLDPKEVAAVFTAPFHAFLRKSWPGDSPGPVQKDGRPEKWYRGSWTDWHESRWRMHNFYIPKPPASPSALLRNPNESHTDSDDEATNALDALTTFRVFGMTARILVDAARVAYGEEPEFDDWEVDWYGEDE
jgi:8-oxo-dGTP pyrophosphatase MutT (NUDIX family)